MATPKTKAMLEEEIRALSNKNNILHADNIKAANELSAADEELKQALREKEQLVSTLRGISLVISSRVAVIKPSHEPNYMDAGRATSAAQIFPDESDELKFLKHVRDNLINTMAFESERTRNFRTAMDRARSNSLFLE